jgi:hypothetical protein
MTVPLLLLSLLQLHSNVGSLSRQIHRVEESWNNITTTTFSPTEEEESDFTTAAISIHTTKSTSTASTSTTSTSTTPNFNNNNNNTAIHNNDLTHVGARLFAAVNDGESLGYHYNYVADVTIVQRLIIQQQQQSQQQHHDNDCVVASSTFLPMNATEQDAICQAAPSIHDNQGDDHTGDADAAGWKVLTETIQVANTTDNPVADDNENNNNTTATTPRRRILCAIYSHAERQWQIQAVAQTWGWRCDGFLAASTATHQEIGAIDLVHNGPESYAVRKEREGERKTMLTSCCPNR